MEPIMNIGKYGVNDETIRQLDLHLGEKLSYQVPFPANSLQQFVNVTEDAFANDDPYTEAYLTVQGATSYKSGSSDYQSAVDSW